MISKDITIEIKTGMEARPVAMLVQIASRYDSSIYIEYANKKVNAKSIMGMMTLGLTSGESVKITAEGEDEAVALGGIEEFLCCAQ
jgi:catabolite repression HPr-like protein